MRSGHGRLGEFTARMQAGENQSGGVQLGVDQVIEVEGSEKPAVITQSLYRFYE